MIKKAKQMILEKIAYLNDEQLEKEAIRAFQESLNYTGVDKMIALGYDKSDIREAEKYERYLEEVATLYEHVANKRGIKIWEEVNENGTND